MTVRLCRHADYVSMPWKNGAGTTLEISRAPAAGADFDWRLSLAQISASGPFSAYAGYERAVALASGAGFAVGVGARPPIELRAAGDSLIFPGEAATCCTLIAGTCTDFSLMVRRPGQVLALERVQLSDERLALRLQAPLAALFCLVGEASCTRADTEPQRLDALDTLLLAAPDDDWSARCARATPTALLIARWQPAGATAKVQA
jgi:uncharacterized protein